MCATTHLRSLSRGSERFINAATMKFHLIVLVLAVLAATVKADPKADLFKGVLKAIKHYVTGSSHQVEGENGKPGFCGKYDCPPFTEKNKTSEYELRCYQEAFWVSTAGSGYPTPMGGANSNMFKKLFGYIQGRNKMKKEIPMTVPVLTEVKGDGSYKKLKMSFYLPEEFQSSPPKPEDPAVFLERKDICVYVRSFGGYPLFYYQYKRQIKQLKKDLDMQGLKGTYIDGTVMYAGYNEPWKLFGRRNEVMLLHA